MGKLTNFVLGTAFSLAIGSCGTAFMYSQQKTPEHLSTDYVGTLCSRTETGEELTGITGRIVELSTKMDQRLSNFFGVEGFSGICDGYTSTEPVVERYEIPEHFDCATMDSDVVLQSCYQLTQDYTNCNQ